MDGRIALAYAKKLYDLKEGPKGDPGDVSTEQMNAAIAAAATDLKSDINIKTDCNLPIGLQSANYQNSSNTRRYKWMNNGLNLFFKSSAGSVSAGEVTNSNASISAGATTTYSLAGKKSAYMRLHYTNTLNSASPNLFLRFMKDNYTDFKEVAISLYNAEGILSVDLVREALKNAFSVTEYPNVFIRKIGWAAHTATATESIEVQISGIYSEPIDYVESSSIINNPFRFKPTYAHLFINTVEDAEADTYVPSQSEYDIEITKRLGFEVIEVNTHILSDGEYICLHGASGKFGVEFVASPDSTYTDAQIQDTTITSVDLEWVKDNVRFKAKYPKMRTAPLTLEEFLFACRKHQMIPLINWKHIDQIEIANEIMGVDNYILYGANLQSRAISKAMFATWENLTTKEAIIRWVKAFGAPCLVGVINYSNFTLSQWKEIVEEVHALGGLMAISDGYITPDNVQNLRGIGFDVIGSLYSLNPVQGGSVISADADFSDFTITDGTYSDGEVALSEDGTIAPASPIMDSSFLTGMWLDVTFTGTLSVKLGRFLTHSNTFTADTPRTIHLSTYALNSAPTFEIKGGTGGATVENIVFKASKL